jgi:hypothetical protein
MSMSTYSPSYPVRVDARLDSHLSRGLWLVKWLLIIPHYLVLAFLWMAFVILSVGALFAILFTGRYPRAIFDFNVGVLRWSWRVTYYAYGALATDRYPPFTLRDQPDYPAHFEIDYPEHLSRGLVLVKWWLLAIPHYIIVGIFVSGGVYLAWAADQNVTAGSQTPGAWDSGLIGLLALIAAIALLFTGTYPRPLFDVILGLNRWVLRVAAYAAPMTDQYPPFRLDQGGDDPGTTLAPTPDPVTPAPRESASGPASESHWGVGRVVSVVLASIVMLFSFGLLAAGTAAAVANHALRNHDGFLMSDTRELSTGTYALASATIELHSAAAIRNLPHQMFGDAKVTATARNGKRLFIGLAHAEDALAYLATVRHATVTGSYGHPSYRISTGQAPTAPPAHSDIWVAQASGNHTQSVAAPVSAGKWIVVVMNSDGSAGVDTAMTMGATVPGLGVLTAVVVAIGGLTLILSAIVLFIALRGATSRPRAITAREDRP